MNIIRQRTPGSAGNKAEHHHTLYFASIIGAWFKISFWMTVSSPRYHSSPAFVRASACEFINDVFASSDNRTSSARQKRWQNFTWIDKGWVAKELKEFLFFCVAVSAPTESCYCPQQKVFMADTVSLQGTYARRRK